VASRIGIENWRLSEPASLFDITSVMNLAHNDLPGKVELGFFLDDIVFGEAAAGIRKAWGTRPITRMAQAELDAQLEARKGQTWITVGHVEGNFYVMKNALGGEQRISLRELMSKGMKHGVLVIPIGCKTAAANLPVGFVKNIGTDAAEAFLKALPVPNPTIADLIVGLQGIGELRFKLRDLLGQLEIEVDDKDGDQISHIKIPHGAPSQGSFPSSATIQNEADALLPWWQQQWWKALTSDPSFYLVVWTALCAGAWLSYQIVSLRSPRSPWAKRLRGPAEIGKVGLGCAAVIVVIGLMIAFPPLFLVALAVGLLWDLFSKMGERG
jgi:hypothetical protein